MSPNVARELVSNNAIQYLPDGQTIELPVLTGSENEKAIDISKLRSQTGHITLDPGYLSSLVREFQHMTRQQ